MVTVTQRTRDDVPDWWMDAMLISSEGIRVLEDKETPREPGWGEGPNLDCQSDYAWALDHFVGERIDPGIAHVVRVLKGYGVETAQSCQGGEGHSYENPTVDILGQPWKALDVCNDFGIPVDQISHVWHVRNGEPFEQVWRVELNARKLAKLRERWNMEEVRDREAFLAWQAGQAKPKPLAAPLIPTVVRIVGSRYGVTPQDLLGEGRIEPTVTARQVAMRLVREIGGISYPEIGRAFNRDHTTVMHACKVTESLAVGDLVEEIHEALA